MKKLICLLVILLLCGCRQGMSREDVIAATKQCEEAGMWARIIENVLTCEIVDVQCVPK